MYSCLESYVSVSCLHSAAVVLVLFSMPVVCCRSGATMSWLTGSSRRISMLRITGMVRDTRVVRSEPASIFLLSIARVC